MRSLEQPAESLAELAVYTLKHAFYSLGVGEGVLVPFVMADSEDQGRILHRFEVETPDHALECAREWINSAGSSVSRYAYAWDGSITINEIRWHAVFVEAGDRVLPNGLLLCQRYESEDGEEEANVAVGEPMLIEKPASRLRNGHVAGSPRN